MSELCYEHHFVSHGRCFYCQMQERYYYDVLNILNSWSEGEKDSDEWRNRINGIKCKPHIHDGEIKNV